MCQSYTQAMMHAVVVEFRLILTIWVSIKCMNIVALVNNQ